MNTRNAEANDGIPQESRHPPDGAREPKTARFPDHGLGKGQLFNQRGKNLFEQTVGFLAFVVMNGDDSLSFRGGADLQGLRFYFLAPRETERNRRPSPLLIFSGGRRRTNDRFFFVTRFRRKTLNKQS